MKVPSQQKAVINHYVQKHAMHVLSNPFLFQDRRRRNSCRGRAPRLVPNLNTDQCWFDIDRAKELRAMICMLSKRGHPFFSTLTDDDIAIILDSGASICMTPEITDFIKSSYQKQSDKKVGGIASGLQVQGFGKVGWTLTNTKGIQVTLLLECYHVPNLPCCLLPLQQLGNIPKTDPDHLPHGAWIGGGTCAKVCYLGHVFEFPYDKSTNLPGTSTATSCNKFCAFVAQEMSDSNTNLTVAQKILLKLHHRCGH